MKEADESRERNQPAKHPQQDIPAEHEAQHYPNEALAPRVKPQRRRAEQQPCRPTRPYAKWKGGGFLFPFIFLCASHNLRLFFICRSGAGMDGICFGSSEGSESARNKIFAENTLRMSGEGRFSAKPTCRPDLVRASIPGIPSLPITDTSTTGPYRQNETGRRLSGRSTEINRFAASVKMDRSLRFTLAISRLS